MVEIGSRFTRISVCGLEGIVNLHWDISWHLGSVFIDLDGGTYGKPLARKTCFKNETGAHWKRRQMQWDTGTSSVIEEDEKHWCTVAELHRLTLNTFKVQSSLGDFRDTPMHPGVGRGQDAIQPSFQTCSSNLCASINRRSRMDRHRWGAALQKNCGVGYKKTSPSI